ncbi:hypothetical protein [Nostoc sp.]|uniref:hypothetical protein n=1 Tax=Nostoc sp. TaxID=1180 RepID=UPI0035931CCE
MLDDLFSHKIHASDLEDWKRRLVKLAQVFLSFDNKPLDRDRFDESLRLLSPTTARSPFRDIYSIYISILGVGHITLEEGVWKCHISETAKVYLIGSEPNVEAFCRLQLSLYQRPDGRGQQYNRLTPSIEHQTQDKTLSLIQDGYRVCPLRLIFKIFEAKARLQGVLQDSICVTPEEVYTLVNCQELRDKPTPDIEELTDALKRFQSHELPVLSGERRFPFLEATGLLKVDKSNNLTLYPYNDFILNSNRNLQIEAIKSLDNFFDDFNECDTIGQIYTVLASGKWANYFDACKTLSSDKVQRIAGEILISPSFLIPEALTKTESTGIHQPSKLPQRRRVDRSHKNASFQRIESQRIVNPEETRILRERRNAWHDLLVRKMRDSLLRAGLEPWETDLIDLLADLENITNLYPNGLPLSNTYIERASLPYFNPENQTDLTFIFEMKSSDDSIAVEQVRKAVAQLYEYRYRYYREGQIKQNALLIIVLQNSLKSYAWMKDYLLFDRHIAVCWLKEDGDEFDCFDECRAILDPLIAS